MALLLPRPKSRLQDPIVPPHPTQNSMAAQHAQERGRHRAAFSESLVSCESRSAVARAACALAKARGSPAAFRYARSSAHPLFLTLQSALPLIGRTGLAGGSGDLTPVIKDSSHVTGLR